MVEFNLEERLAFFDKNLFDVSSEQVCLEETQKEGRSRLICNLNTCSIAFKNADKSKLNYISHKKCADNIVFQRVDENNWVVKIIEFKRSVGIDEWKKVKQQFKGAILNSMAIGGFLGIHNISEIVLYTAFRRDKLSEQQLKNTHDPILLKLPLGRDNKANFADWNSEEIMIDLKDNKFKHIKIQLDIDGNGEVTL